MGVNAAEYKKRIGLLGGSFNPAHRGHLYISQEAIKSLALDEVWWLVNPCNPMKEPVDMMPIFERVRVANQIAAPSDKIKVSAIEEDLDTVYTYDTAVKLKAMYPLATFVWIMGDDLLPDFPHWKMWKELLDLLEVAVFTRQFTLAELDKLEAVQYLKQKGKWNYIEIAPNPISSTKIREGTC